MKYRRLAMLLLMAAVFVFGSGMWKASAEELPSLYLPLMPERINEENECMAGVYLSQAGTVYASKSASNVIRQYRVQAGKTYRIEGMNRLISENFTMISFSAKPLEGLSQKTAPLIRYTAGMPVPNEEFTAESDGYLFVASNAAKAADLKIFKDQEEENQQPEEKPAVPLAPERINEENECMTGVYLSQAGTVYASKSASNVIRQYRVQAGKTYRIEGMNRLIGENFTMISFSTKPLEGLSQKTAPLIRYTAGMPVPDEEFTAESDGYLFVASNITKAADLKIFKDQEEENQQPEEKPSVPLTPERINENDECMAGVYLSQAGTVYASKSASNVICQYRVQAGKTYRIEGMNRLIGENFTMISFSTKPLEGLSQKTAPLIRYTAGMPVPDEEFTAESDGYLFVASNAAKAADLKIFGVSGNDPGTDPMGPLVWGSEQGYFAGDAAATSPVEKRAMLVDGDYAYFMDEFVLCKVCIADGFKEAARYDFREIDGYSLINKDICSSIVRYKNNVIITMRSMGNDKKAGRPRIGAIVVCRMEDLSLISCNFIHDNEYSAGSDYVQLRPTGSAVYKDYLITGMLQGGFVVNRINENGSVDPAYIYESGAVKAGNYYREFQKPVLDVENGYLLFPLYSSGFAVYSIADDAGLSIDHIATYGIKTTGGGSIFNLTVKDGYVFAPVCKTETPEVLYAKISDVSGTMKRVRVPDELSGCVGTVKQFGDVSPLQISVNREGYLAINLDSAGIGIFKFEDGTLAYLRNACVPSHGEGLLVGARYVLFDDEGKKLYVSYKIATSQSKIGTYIKAYDYGTWQ